MSPQPRSVRLQPGVRSVRLQPDPDSPEGHYVPRAAVSWSGGKDCCTALQRVRADYDVVAAVTMFAEDGERSRSHGLRPEILAAQAGRLGLRPFSGRCTWETYTDEYIRVLGEVAAAGVTHMIFGDIMFDAHKAWNAKVCAAHGLTPVMPIWNEPTDRLLTEFLASGGEAMIVTVRDGVLDPSWLGRMLTLDAMGEFQRLGVDPCGENGEYHTLVTNSRLFSSPLQVRTGEQVMKGPCRALDLELAGAAETAGAAR
jgi:diphthine-ammonia ligase